ncbi:hypothetical protein AOB60_43140 [Streptomyces noursei]|uniref:Uncharacterized protein n=2 Tax=Actinomycetota TaxID=201174 RepID=A0A2N8P453_STRNR|nr:hypothetical protein AOB60_43140 [Streptomyces noursei]
MLALLAVAVPLYVAIELGEALTSRRLSRANGSLDRLDDRMVRAEGDCLAAGHHGFVRRVVDAMDHTTDVVCWVTGRVGRVMGR